MHPSATTTIEVLPESLTEILMTVKFSLQYHKSYDTDPFVFKGAVRFMKNHGIIWLNKNCSRHLNNYF